MQYLNPIAELNTADSGELIDPKSAYEIRTENEFFCPDFDCKDPKRILIPIISGKGNHFFRHRGNYKHDIHPETLLHKSAINWFKGKTEYEIPAFESNTFSIPKQTVQLDSAKTVCEFRGLKQIVPDVKVYTLNGFEFAIEIVVTNDLNNSKKKLIGEFGLPVVRVDLSSFYKANKNECQVDYKFIQAHLPGLLMNPQLKSWIISPSEDLAKQNLISTSIEKAVTKQDGGSNDVGCLLVILTAGLIYLFKKK